MVEGEDVAVDLFAEANKAVEEEEKEQQEADEGDADRARQQIGHEPYHQFESDGRIQPVSRSSS